MAERTQNEAGTSSSLQQFEAAAGFGGLGLNVGKTGAMGCRIKKAVVSEEVENAMKERISVKVKGVEIWGWIVPTKWRAELGISQWSDEQVKRKMAIQFDNGDKWLVDLRGSWSDEQAKGKMFDNGEKWLVELRGSGLSMIDPLCMHYRPPW